MHSLGMFQIAEISPLHNKGDNSNPETYTPIKKIDFEPRGEILSQK